MANHYSTQAGGGAHDGSTKANAWSLAEMASEWGTVANEVIFFDDSFTDLVSIGAHSSAVIPLQVRFDDVGSEGDVHVATGNALVVPGATSRNDTHVFGGTFLSDNANGIRLEAVTGSSGRHFNSCIANGNALQGVTIIANTGTDLTDIKFDLCEMNLNGGSGVRTIVLTGAVDFDIDGFVFTNNKVNLNTLDGFRMTQEEGNTASFFDNFVLTGNEFNNNGLISGGRGLWLGHFDSDPINGWLTITGNQAIGNGDNTVGGGGGMTIQGWNDSGGSIGDTNVYIADNICSGNHGGNSGMNLFGLNNGLVENNICNDNEVDASGWDGNGLIVDNTCTNLEVRYVETSRNLGNQGAAVNSGVGLMVLFDLNNIRVHHCFGAGNYRAGNWTSHNESTQTQTDIEFWNCTYLDCIVDGFRQGSAGSPLENTVMNCLYVGRSGSVYGFDNARDGGSEQVIANYNLYDAFDTADYNDQTPGANDVTDTPTFQPDITIDDDFTGTDALTLDELPNGLWEIQGGTEGERVIEISSNSIFCTSNGSGGAGVQTVYMVADQGVHDHWIELTVDSGWSTEITNACYGAIRITDVNNALILRLTGTGASGVRVIKVIAGVETQIISAQPAADSVYRMEVHSEEVELFKDDVSQGTATVLVTELPITNRAGMFAEADGGVSPQWTAFSHGISLPNMRPAAGSPAVNAGTTNGEGYNIDPDGQPHGFGGTWDIGAYEFASVIITDVSDDESWSDADTGIPITGTGFV